MLIQFIAILRRPVMALLLSSASALSLVVASDTKAAEARPESVPALAPSRTVSAEAMQGVFDQVKTPFKYGIVLRGEEGEFVDCPSIFRRGNRWYMVYVAIRDKVGYQTYLARSDDLLHWEKLGKILSFRKDTWDAWQADGGISLYDYRWDGSHELETFQDRYWLSYIGGALQGYEPDPLAIGLAHTADPTQAKEWERLPDSVNPVLSSGQTDTRAFESVTLYKSTIIHDEAQTLGYPFVMFYNGKRGLVPVQHEAIGMAVSRDMREWRRYGNDPVIDHAPNDRAISGDPQIAKIGDLWVMFYFGAFWKPGAFDTFACSYDLVHWTRWQGESLIEPSEPFDKTYAHKPWVLQHEGIVYHFYCAVGSEGRVIALATSRDLKPSPPR